MTGTIFKQWITNVDNDISMKTHGRRILLIIDNATCHIIPEIELQSIDILFLAPKTTSLLQPLDAGIWKLLSNDIYDRLQFQNTKHLEGLMM